MKQILIAEDEDSIREFVALNLRRNGYDVVESDNGERALSIYDNLHSSIDVVLLDVMMPGLDGITVCKEIRKRSSTVGIIMLSAKSQEMDKVAALMYGADDYMTKPFAPGELLARVDALHRRVRMAPTVITKVTPKEHEGICQGPFVLDIDGRILKKGSQQIELTQIEFQIMRVFFENPNELLTRETLLEKAWGDCFTEVKTVDVNMRRLRMKIEDNPSDPQYIKTVWGRGYIWSVDSSETYLCTNATGR